MTDREMALQLGRLIISLQQRMKTLEAVIMECLPEGLSEVAWTEKVRLAEQDIFLRQVSAAQLNGLRQAFDAEIQDSLLIRVLGREFLQGHLEEIGEEGLPKE